MAPKSFFALVYMLGMRYLYIRYAALGIYPIYIRFHILTQNNNNQPMKTILVSLCVIGAMAFTANAKSFELASPDGNVTVVVDDSKGLAYSVSFKGQQIINNSPISLTIDNGKTVTVGQKITSAKRSSHNGSFDAFAYK